MNGGALFDCNAHPTVDGCWVDGKSGCEFKVVERELINAGFTGAAAVGLPGVGGYCDHSFLKKCQAWSWIPVAGWSQSFSGSVHNRISDLKSLGFKAVKLHPRLLGGLPSIEDMCHLLNAAQVVGLPVMLCSYPFYPASKYPYIDFFSYIHECIHAVPDVKLMLMHSGGVDLLRYVEFARMNKNITLDLSFTMLKYEGSSIDLDVAFTFKNFDRRIVIGSDFPEFNFDRVRKRFWSLAKDLPNEQRENIAYNNALSFFCGY